MEQRGHRTPLAHVLRIVALLALISAVAALLSASTAPRAPLPVKRAPAVDCGVGTFESVDPVCQERAV